MKFSKFAAIGALAFAAATAAHAGPTSITGSDDPVSGGSYSFAGTSTHSFYIDLDAGTYSFSAGVDAFGTTTLADVWFSNSKDKKDSGKNDVAFTSVSAIDFDGSLSNVTFAKPTRVFIDVDAIVGGGKKKNSGYNGTLTISAVPEPATTALLLAGLGMIGFVGRRRSNKI